MGVTLLPPVIERHDVAGVEVVVVRDDLCCPFPGPNNSKVRGLSLVLDELKDQGEEAVASVDMSISRLGWGLAWAARGTGIQVVDICADGKSIDFYRMMCLVHGGQLLRVRGSYHSAMLAQARRLLRNVVILEAGLAGPWSLEAHARLLDELDLEMFSGSVVLCSSSGTIAASLRYAMNVHGARGTVHAVQSFRNRSAAHKAAKLLVGRSSGLIFHESGYGYTQPCRLEPPFPSDPYLDRKAWEWLTHNVLELPKPVLFWNIGGEWDISSGLGRRRGDGLTTVQQVRDVISGWV